MQRQPRNYAITNNSDNTDNKGANAVSEQAAKADDIRCEKAKSPAELAVGIPRMSGEFNAPRREMLLRRRRIDRMGQVLNNPPGVERWRYGLEWLSAVALMQRINFASERFGDAHKPCVRATAASIAGTDGDNAPPETLVDRCLAWLGAPIGGLPRIPARTASVSDARQSRNHATTAIIPITPTTITPTTREQAP